MTTHGVTALHVLTFSRFNMLTYKAETQKMPYITSVERMGIQKGIE
jgi:hypothetical protein